MELHRILEIVADCDATYFELVRGPWGTAFSIDVSDGTVGFYGHHARAVFRADVAVAIEFGLQYDDGRDWQEPWATFADRTIRGFWADITYNGQVVLRRLMLSVDGGRCVLPAPRPVIEGVAGNAVVAGQAVTRHERDFARLVDELSSGRDFERYFQHSQFVIEG